MKIFQIVNGFCWWDATATVHSVEEASEMFAPDCVFVEAPDFAHEGWGYDETAEGDARFLRPEVPDGWDYDDNSGTYSPTEPDTSNTPSMPETLTAEQNIADDAYFIAGRRLFRSTRAITAGETISPGVNCEEISIADALNALEL